MGTPTVVVATERFFDLARQSGEQVGLDGARIVAIAHPVGGVADDALCARADAAIEDVMGCLLTRTA